MKFDKKETLENIILHYKQNVKANNSTEVSSYIYELLVWQQQQINTENKGTDLIFLSLLAVLFDEHPNLFKHLAESSPTLKIVLEQFSLFTEEQLKKLGALSNAK